MCVRGPQQGAVCSSLVARFEGQCNAPEREEEESWELKVIASDVWFARTEQHSSQCVWRGCCRVCDTACAHDVMLNVGITTCSVLLMFINH